MSLSTAANQVESTPFVHAAMLVTRPGEAPALQWIVDPSLHDALVAFHEEAFGGAGTFTEHGPTRGASKGFSVLRVATTDVPPELVEQLPRRLRAAMKKTKKISSRKA